MADLTGHLLKDRYRVDSLLGRGGMAEVYLTFDTRRQTNVALKVLREDLADDPEFVRRFAREATALARLDHPHIVRFYAFERDGADAFIVMDYVPGTNLQRRLMETGGPLPTAELTRIVRSVGAALQYAHTEGYIHRDLKPGNIMLREDGTPLLSDFGIARAVESATAATAAMGTPAYMSPEQILGRELDRRSDIYSLGIVLCEAATGRRPFTGDEQGLTATGTLARLREAHLRLPPPDPRTVNPALPAGVANVILRALAKDPAQRWPDVVSLMRAWDAAIGSPAVSPRLPPAPGATAAGQPGPGIPTTPTREASVPGAISATPLRSSLPGSAAARLPTAAAPPTPSGRGLRGPESATPRLVSSVGRSDRVAPPTWAASQPLQADTPPVHVRRGPSLSTWLFAVTAALLVLVVALLALTAYRSFGSSVPITISARGEILLTSTHDGKREVYWLSSKEGMVRGTFTAGSAESWSPVPEKGGSVLFTSNRDGKWELYRLTSAGQVTRVTQTAGSAASWGPVPERDGSILFTSDRGGKREAYRLTAGGEIERVTNTPGGESWSPVPTQSGAILFTSNRDGKREAYVIDPSGQTIRITVTAGKAESWGAVPGPDGAIIFTSNRSGKQEIYRLDPSGQVSRLTNTPDPGESWGAVPELGEDLFFTSTRDGKREIYRLTAGGSVVRVTRTPGDGESWTPGW